MGKGYGNRPCRPDRPSFLMRLCGYCYTTKIWCILYEAGGAYGYSEILRFVGCSPSTLSQCLSYLLADGLVRMVGRKYQAVRPPADSAEPSSESDEGQGT